MSRRLDFVQHDVGVPGRDIADPAARFAALMAIDRLAIRLVLMIDPARG